MNLFNGVFSKSSAFSMVVSDPSSTSHGRHRRSVDYSTNVHSSSSNPSLERDRNLASSSERQSSSDRDLTMNSDAGGSMERQSFERASPTVPQGHSFIKPKAIKPNSNFGFLSNCNINSMKGFGVNSPFYWMKYQMILQNHHQAPNPVNVVSEESRDEHRHFQQDEGDDQSPPEKMVGKLTASERKRKVEKYLMKKRKKSQGVRYECRKNLAQKRLRYQGRFISAKEAEKLDQRLIYNPSNALVPKPIFHTFKDTARWRKKCSYQKLHSASVDSLECRKSCQPAATGNSQMDVQSETNGPAQLQPDNIQIDFDAI